MNIDQSEFDNLVEYTLRIEFLSGKVFLYRIDKENKQYLVNKLDSISIGGGAEDQLNKPLPFLRFETSLNRLVVLNLDSITRLTFCFDYPHDLQNGINYYDNFGLLPKDLINEKLDNEEYDEDDEEQYLPQAIILHKGLAPEDNYEGNPLTYEGLSKGCLSEFDFELEGEFSLRQFINLTDNDGEETFIPLKQIVVMEFDSNLMYDEDDDEDDDEIEEDETDETDDKDFTLLN